MPHKSFKDLDYIPETIGLAVGIGDGIVSSKVAKAHARTYYRAAVLGTAIIGDKAAHWHPDITIGMMTAAATLMTQSIVGKAEGVYSTAFPAAVPGIQEPSIPSHQPPTAAGAWFPGVQEPSIPAAQPPTAAGAWFPGVQEPSIPAAQPPTAAGAWLPGSGTRTDIPHMQPPTAAGYANPNRNPGAGGRPDTQRPTAAG